VFLVDEKDKSPSTTVMQTEQIRYAKRNFKSLLDERHFPIELNGEKTIAKALNPKP